MSLCIRTISNKLTPFVGPRKVTTRVDRQLPKHIEKTSTFYDEFLFGGACVKNEGQESVIYGNLVSKPLKTTSDNIVAWNYKLQNDRNWNIEKNKQNYVEDVTKNFSNDCSSLNTSTAVLSVAEKEAVVQSKVPSGVQHGLSSENPLGRPSQEQLNHVYEVLSVDLPNFFVKSIDYHIYHPDIVFENNFKGTVTRGMYEYVKQAAMFRIIAHFKFAYVKFEVLKITVHTEDNSIKVRWRIRGLSSTKVFLKFWQFRLWELQKTIDQLMSWHDGFSTFYVSDSGQIIKHVADKMMPDQDNEVTTLNKTNITAKLALFLGLLAPREFITDITPLMSSGIDPDDKDSVKTADSSLK